MIAKNDSLYLFSKNWGNHKTYLYSLPNEPGAYATLPIDSLDINGLVTGAAYNSQSEEVILIGYKPYLVSSFLCVLQNYSNNDFFGATHINVNLSLMLHQVEGVEYLGNSSFVFTNETFSNIDAGLRRGNLDDLNTIFSEESDLYQPVIYPNPARNYVTIKNCGQYKSIIVYDLAGQVKINYMIDSETVRLNLNCLLPGVYPIEFVSNTKFYTDILVVE